MTDDRRHLLWRIGARAVAGLLVASATYFTAVVCCGLIAAPHSGFSWASVALAAVGAAFWIGFVALIGWVAWRLWARWNAMTVRLLLGASIAMPAIVASQRLREAIEPRSGRDAAETMSNALLLAAVAVGAVVYRRATAAISRSAGLVDVLDASRQPLGHRDRARAFCIAMGWGVWMTAFQAADWAGWDLQPNKGADLMPLALAGPVLLGWLTFKLLAWRLVPKPLPPVPLGGFEVRPITSSDRPLG